jgi:hypothetical protein
MLLSSRSLIKSLLCEKSRDVVDAKTIAHACVVVRLLDDSDVPVAEVVSGDRAMKDAERDDLPAFEADYLVSVLSLSTIAIVHYFLPAVVEAFLGVGLGFPF